MRRLGLTLALAGLATPALAQEARCFTTDDGEYPCSLEALDEVGSFRTSAPGKPTFEVWMDAPGRAVVGAVFEPGGRSVSLPGTYNRSEEDGACWVSDATAAELCAW
ncbi:MAG: hypothetical protein JWP99_265 [Devosia sp.]|nr:hypothetical protein [Devosia sp.]